MARLVDVILDGIKLGDPRAVSVATALIGQSKVCNLTNEQAQELAEVRRDYNACLGVYAPNYGQPIDQIIVVKAG